MPFLLLWLLNITALIRYGNTQNTSMSYSIPTCPQNGTARQQAIAVKRTGYLYGPSLMGNTSYFPSGSLGDAMVERDIAQWTVDYTTMQKLATEDAEGALQALAQVSSHSRTIIDL